MKIALCSIVASLALAAAGLSGCQINGSRTMECEAGACTDKAGGACCSGEKAEGASCCSTEKAAAASCCSAEKTAAAAPAGLANTTCPFSGGPAKETITVAYNGQTVGLCCAGCKGKWEKASDADRAAMFSKVAKAAK